MPYLSTSANRKVVLVVYVQPRASRTCITGLHDGAIKLAITAPPVEGKANAQVTDFFAKLLGIPKSAVTILSGLQGRTKRIAVTGLSPEEVRQVLAPHLNNSPK